jgi:acetate kinase
VTRVLVVNAGSATLKLRVLDEHDRVLHAADLGPGDVDGIAGVADAAGPIAVAGHRVVHGGHRFRAPVVVDAEVLAALEALAPLAPLHQPANVAGIRAVAAALPAVPSVACFDTSFHATIPPAAATYPIPAEWRERFGLRRFGFHGLSHAYAARRVPEVAGGDGGGRLVVCHLGAGSSLSAVVEGTCVDTTMGFTPNEGLPMATRSGSVDVGMLTWLLEAGLSRAELADGLQHRAGLTGLAGTGDMREVLARADAGDGAARLAVEVWLHRLVQGVAAMAASAGGLDLLAFTGGIGEGAAGLRARAADRLAWLGVAVDPVANVQVGGDGADAVVSPPGARVTVVVVHAREDVEIARAARVASKAG